MTVPYSYADPDGDSLQILPAQAGGVRVVSYDAFDGNSIAVRVLPDAVPEMVAALYRAAGQTTPVLINPGEVADDWAHVTGTGGTAPTQVLRAAVHLLRNPYNCLPGKDQLADLLDAVAEGTPARVWTAALAIARAQYGIDDVLARSVNDTTGDPA
ncbi:hypothetical protein [Actinomadura decatromicini]|uniref:Uncharacterized protein n=1 Tax=Actinomadura decatromicini TaxID=2604572 RepID=A0A5D3F869_9ACTN|nr:hypothetical protein [Actinomadura decatromicini]TYK45207.1 hypothetical protein FXF68_31515 [Actinomadura decatromicini]